MDGKELLKALMKEADLNPNALADLLGSRSLQSQIKRYVDGTTRNPRWETLRPVAEFFKIRVEALFDDTVASEVAKERGLTTNRQIAAECSPDSSIIAAAPTPLRPIARPTIYSLLLQIASELQPYDLSARKAVASLLGDIALTPETAVVTAERIERLLDVPGNGERRRKSTRSPPRT